MLTYKIIKTCTFAFLKILASFRSKGDVVKSSVLHNVNCWVCWGNIIHSHGYVDIEFKWSDLHAPYCVVMVTYNNTRVALLMLWIIYTNMLCCIRSTTITKCGRRRWGFLIMFWSVWCWCRCWCRCSCRCITEENGHQVDNKLQHLHHRNGRHPDGDPQKSTNISQALWKLKVDL